MSDRCTVIVDGVRSPVGIKSGQMIGMRSDDLSAQTIKALLERNNSINHKSIEDIVLGCAFPEGPQGMLMAKGVAILSGLPETTTGKVVNRFCGSSMDSLHQLSQAINSGDIDCGIACGVEDMFGVPMGGFSPSFHPELYEKDYYMGMGETAENLAQELNISRSDQEDFAINSHKKALAAASNGSFSNEIIPIEFNGNTINNDEGPREPNIDKIKSLDPAFDSEGTITAATSSPVSIGSSAILLASNTLAENSGLKPEFKVYIKSVINNAKVLSEELLKRGLNIVSGGTDTHVVLVDLRPKELTGNIAEDALERAGITCNKNGIPFDPEKPSVTSGIRLGTPAGTSRGFGEKEFILIANLISDVLDGLRKEKSFSFRILLQLLLDITRSITKYI